MTSDKIRSRVHAETKEAFEQSPASLAPSLYNFPEEVAHDIFALGFKAGQIRVMESMAQSIKIVTQQLNEAS